jgi:hypothetical protein
MADGPAILLPDDGEPRDSRCADIELPHEILMHEMVALDAVLIGIAQRFAHLGIERIKAPQPIPHASFDV